MTLRGRSPSPESYSKQVVGTWPAEDGLPCRLLSTLPASICFPSVLLRSTSKHPWPGTEKISFTHSVPVFCCADVLSSHPPRYQGAVDDESGRVCTQDWARTPCILRILGFFGSFDIAHAAMTRENSVSEIILCSRSCKNMPCKAICETLLTCCALANGQVRQNMQTSETRASANDVIVYCENTAASCCFIIYQGRLPKTVHL